MYLQAARLKLRFPSGKGELSVEDLFDLPLSSSNRASLDDTTKEVNRQLKEAGEESFVTTTTKVNSVLQLKLDILKDVISIKLAENLAATFAKKNAEQRKLIMSLIEQKKQGQLAEMSVEDLEKMLAGS